MLEQRQMQEGSVETVSVSYLLGLISEQQSVKEQLSGLTESLIRTHELGLGVVVQAQMIKETIELLPPYEGVFR
jgi:hypothetical protein